MSRTQRAIQLTSLSAALAWSSFAHAAITAPSDLYFYCQSPYSQLKLFWTDKSTNETGFRIEQKTETGSWVQLAQTNANQASYTLNNYDRSQTKEFRVSAINGTEVSAVSNSARVVGLLDTLEVYPEVPGIKAPQTLTRNGITFSEMQDQTPADPSQGKATRVSTFFTVKVKPQSGGTLQNSPTYETRPQLRNYLPQNAPEHTGGHRPYAYGYYGPVAGKAGSSLHSKHWTNLDAAENVVVRITLKSTANLPGPIDMNDLEIHPEPLAIQQVNSTTVDVTLPGATDFARHYRVAFNREAWSHLSSTSYRGDITIEAPLFIFINPMQLAPASAPEDQVKEFDDGTLVVFGPGIHLPNPHYQFLGEGENDAVRELFAPGDAYLHYGFAFQNNSYALKAWGRAIYSDEMFDVYNNGDAGDYTWSDPARTPWASQDALDGSRWFTGALWEAHTWLRGKYKDEPTIFEGFTNIGARIGVMTKDGYSHLLNHKDLGYGGGIYQHGTEPKAYYRGNLIANDDDITYIHQDYQMEHNTTYIMHNGPSFQFGWQSAFDLHNLPAVIKDHTIWSSDRRDDTVGSNHGVFDSRMRIDAMKNHNGVTFENFEFYGKETIIWNMRIWDEDMDFTPNTVSILGDKTFKNFNVREASYNKEVLCTETDVENNKQAYIRFFHFDNLVIEGNPISHIDDGNYFAYNQLCPTKKEVSDGVLLHTITFFSLPAAKPMPASGDAPIGDTIQIQSRHNGQYVQADSSLPVSFSPLTANDASASQGFTVVDAGNGLIALKAENGYYVKADPKRYGYLYTQPDLARGDIDTKAITDDALFVWVDLGGNDFALYSKAMKLYVKAEQNSGPNDPLYAASGYISNWEKFTYQGSSSAITPPAGFTQLVFKHNKCLEIGYSSLENKGNAQQWTCSNIATKHWELIDQGNGFYLVANQNSGKCLEISSWSQQEGGNAQQWTCTTSANKLFKLENAGNGYFQLVNKNSGMCLDTQDGSTANGANVIQMTCSDAETQKLKFQ